MDVELLARTVLPWLATWFAHSTVLLLAVWGITRLARRLRPSTQVVLWRAALFGPLLTATLPLVIEMPTAAARIALLPAETIEAPDAAALPADLASSVIPVAPLDDAAPLPLGAAPAALPLASADAPPATSPVSVGAWVLLAWVCAAGLLLLRSLLRSHRVRRRIAARSWLADPELVATLERLTRRAGVRRPPALTIGTGLESPVAWGIWRPEIFLPRRAFEELSREQQEALLAHELGHIVRRDAFWLALERMVTSVLCVQPLHVVARRHIREQTELACDELAVAFTQQPLALAECLAEVAGWIVQQRTPAPAPAMASNPSLLARRVELLLDTPTPRASGSRAALAGVLGLLVLVALGAPGFTERAAASVTDALVETPEAAAPEPAGATADTIQSALREIDAELRLVKESLIELEGLAAALPNHPEVQKAVLRLVDRSKTLFERRDALVRAADGEDR